MNNKGLQYNHIIEHKVAVFDLDGTILDESENLYEGIKEALFKLPTMKYIATGRIKESIKELKEFQLLTKIFEPFIVCYDGNAIYNTKKNQMIMINTLNYKQILSIFKLFYDIADFVVDCGGELFASSKKAGIYFAMYYKISRKKIRVVDIKKHRLDNVLLVFIISENGKEYYQFNDLDLEIIYQKINSNIVKIIPKNSNKTNGVKQILTALGYTFDNVISFGNDLNDIDLIKSSDVGVAVNNSKQELISIANYCLNEPLIKYLYE